jgi:RNA polymerase sigma-70 factor (ECF subfamily)
MGSMREPSDDSGVCRNGAERKEAETREYLEAIRRGDADAFERLAREHSPRLYRLALHLTGKPEDAEDLVQETLVRTLPALRRFEGRAALSTYLVRSLSNLWKNRLRSKSRSRIVDWFAGRGGGGEEEPGLPEPVNGSPSPQERLEAGDRAVLVREAVAGLEPARRLTLLLREVEDRSYEEIAEMTGVPVGTVRSRLARAREDLRMALGGRL